MRTTKDGGVLSQDDWDIVNEVMSIHRRTGIPTYALDPVIGLIRLHGLDDNILKESWNYSQRGKLSFENSLKVAMRQREISWGPTISTTSYQYPAIYVNTKESPKKAGGNSRPRRVQPTSTIEKPKDRHISLEDDE